MSAISSVAPSASLASTANSGLEALATSSQKLNQDAQQIANPDNQNMTAPLLDLSQAKLLGQAGADVIRSANQMIGTLLDVLA
jgi:hypothetical protein